MDQLKKIFGALSLPQRIGLAFVIVLVAAGIPAFTHWEHERDFRPLFTNMAPEDAGAVVQKLKESGVEHRLADNGATVEVPAEKVDEMRLELAGAGLPKSGRIGFELFDKTNLGLTDFGEHVNYRRALEGELERSVKALNSIEQARVHVTFPKDSVFLDAREPAKASVLVRLRPGAALTPQNVLAITNLVASAVEGLSPEFVSVVDMQGNLLSRPRKQSADGADSADGVLEYKHQVEKDLTAKVEATLDPLLGEGKFRVGVSADCDFSQSEQTDETFDPSRSVMATSQKTEDVAAGPLTGGVPGTPSNLPRSSIQSALPRTGSGASRRTENVSFETSRSIRQVKVPRGTLKRISAALLLDQDVEWQGKGAQRKRVLIAPTPEKLKAIRDVVAGVLGIVPERGDQLVIESLPFEQTRALEEATDTLKPPAGTHAPALKLYQDKRVLIGAGVAVLLVIVLLVFRRKSKGAAELADAPAALSAGRSGAHRETETPPAVAGTNAAGQVGEQAPKLQLPPITSKAQDMLSQIQDSVHKDPVFAANILRGWLEED
ncbi:MAG TPA: flagellar basal-body MS-ring/collar protein FliF [Bryobacteraceae bacterium]